MDLGKPLRLTLLNTGIAVGALAIGVALVAVGVVAGFGASATSLVADPLNAGEALESANPTITIALSVLGYVVWRFGATYATFATLPRAAGESAAEQFDTERVKSEILEVLDRRLSEMHDDVEETRRSVQELKREEHATSFEEDAIDSTDASGTGAALESGSSVSAGSTASSSSSSSTRSSGDPESRSAARSRSDGDDRSSDPLP